MQHIRSRLHRCLMTYAYTRVYLIGVPMSVISIIAAICMKNVKMDFSHRNPKPAQDAESKAAGVPAKPSESVVDEGDQSEKPE